MDILQVNNIKKKYFNKEILKDISFEGNEGEIISVIGDNGCGKSTLLKIILSLANQTSGEIIFSDNIKIGGVIETPMFFPNLSGRDNILSILDSKNVIKEELEKIANDFLMLEYLDRIVKKYSLGMKQKLSFILTFLANYNILVFDEPTNALDQKALKMLKTYLLAEKEKGKLLIVSSHNYGYICDFSDRIFEIKNGILSDVLKQEKKENFNHKFLFDDIESAKQTLEGKNIPYTKEANYIIINDSDISSTTDLFLILAKCKILKYEKVLNKGDNNEN